MTNELVNRMMQSEIIEKLNPTDIEDTDLSKPVLLIELTNKFLVSLYFAKKEMDPSSSDISFDSEELIRNDIKRALLDWFHLDKNSLVENQRMEIENMVNIIYPCLINMKKKIKDKPHTYI